MVDKLSVTIELAGADQIKQQLADIGDAGTKAFADIGKAAEQVGGFKELDPSVVTDKLKEMGVTGVDQIKKIQDAVASASKLESLVQGVQAAEEVFKLLGLTAGGVLGGIVAALVAIVPRTIAWAESIQQVNAQATKLGLSVEQFNQLQNSLEKAGVSGKDAATAIEKIGQAVDKANLDTVNTAFKQLQDAASRGFGAVGTTQLKALQDAAEGTGKAAEQARQDLEKLGQPLPTDLPQTLAQLYQQTGNVTQAVAAFADELANLPAGQRSAAFAFDQLGQAGQQLFEQLKSGAITVDQFKQSMQTIITEDQVTKANAVTEAFGNLKAAWKDFMGAGGAGADIVVGALNLITEALKEVQAGLQATVKDWNALNDIVNTVGKAVYDFGNVLGQLNWNPIDAGIRAWNDLVGAIQGAIDKVLRFLGLQPSGGAPAAGGDQSAGLAGGGLIGGRGSGTSDSNLAWVSRGEHIMPAAAVAQPGVLAFLEALRGTGGNLRAVLNGMGRFALGGMVPRIPAFAGGGLVSGMSHVTIQFPGLPPIGGLRATSAVVDELQRAAVLAQVRSGGRKPSRYT